MVLLVRRVIQVDLQGPQLRDLEVDHRVLSDEVLGEAVVETVLEVPLLGEQVTDDDVFDQDVEVPVKILGGHDSSFLVVVIISRVNHAKQKPIPRVGYRLLRSAQLVLASGSAFFDLRGDPETSDSDGDSANGTDDAVSERFGRVGPELGPPGLLVEKRLIGDADESFHVVEVLLCVEGVDDALEGAHFSSFQDWWFSL